MVLRHLLLAGVAFFGLAGCGRSVVPAAPNNGNCISMADSIQTLREGDELPRVVQVLGMPERAFRTFSPFGRSYDVLEYSVGTTPCVRTILGADKGYMRVVFDPKGGYLGAGREAAMVLRRVSTTRVQPLVLDDSVLRP